MTKRLWVCHNSFKMYKTECIECIFFFFFIKGVLLDQRNESLVNFKLTSSNNLTVKAINKYGAFELVNLYVNVSIIFY